MLQLITSNFYSVLFYNSEIWHLPSLKSSLKHSLLSASAKAIKLCMFYPDIMILYKQLHKMNKRALPSEIMIYKHALQLHKLYNTELRTQEWCHLNFNQILTSRQDSFKTHISNKNKVGLNALANRLNILNGIIPLKWLNISFHSFKIKCKARILRM